MVNVVYIHGRPSGHPIHDGYAKLINSDFCFSDHKVRWNDVENASKLRRTISWIMSAVQFPKRKMYDIFFSEGVREIILIMKWLGLISKKQKIVALMANENLFLISTKQYSFFANFLMVSFLKKCDALICIGSYQANLAQVILPKAKIHTIFNGIPTDRMDKLNMINPNLASNKILVITHANSITRMHYKGTDLAFNVFNKLAKVFPHLELHIIGNCSNDVMNYCKKLLGEGIKNKHFFHGEQNTSKYLTDACLLLQLGRGDSFPTTTIEAAAAGVPVFVTNETGTKEVVNQINPLFVTTLEPSEIFNSVKKYIQFSDADKNNLSNEFKNVSKFYSQKNANENFINTINNIYAELNVQT